MLTAEESAGRFVRIAAQVRMTETDGRGALVLFLQWVVFVIASICVDSVESGDCERVAARGVETVHAKRKETNHHDGEGARRN